MKTIVTTATMIAVVVVASNAIAQREITQKQIDKIDSIFKSDFKPTEPGAVVLLAQDGKVLLRKAYGMANLELRVPMYPDHVLAIGSITKQFTAVSLLMLQEQGKLSVEDDIHKYVPEFNSQGHVIKIKNLLSHTAGIGSSETLDFDSFYRQDKNEYALVNFVNGKPMLFEPGTNWSYSNASFMLCGVIIERVSKMPYKEFVAKNIFTPLQMNNTCFGSEKVIPNKTTGYAPSPNGFVVNEMAEDWIRTFAGGGILSTVDDMLKWNEALQNNKLIKSGTLEAAHTTFKLKDQTETNYGFGWSVFYLKQFKVVTHGGLVNGYSAQQVNLPAQGVYLIAITNQFGRKATNSARKATYTLLQISPPKIISIDSAKLPIFKGVYESVNLGSRLQSNYSQTPRYFYVWPEKGKLFIKRTAARRIELQPTSEFSFIEKNDPTAEYFFQQDAKGAILSLMRKQLFTDGPYRINKKLNAELPPPANAISIDSASASIYVGIYKLDNISDREYIFYKKGKLLYKSDPESKEQELAYTGNDTFVMKEDDQQVLRFTKDKKGKVVHMNFTTFLYEEGFSRVEVPFK